MLRVYLQTPPPREQFGLIIISAALKRDIAAIFGKGKSDQNLVKNPLVWSQHKPMKTFWVGLNV